MSRRPTVPRTPTARPARATAGPASRPPRAAGPAPRAGGRAATRSTAPGGQVEQQPATVNISLRAIALTLVIMVAFVLVFPRLQAFLAGRQQIAQAGADIAAAQKRVVTLQTDLERWQDPQWIAQQARQRLNYIFPGETAYRVVDPEYVTDALAGAQVDPAKAPTVLTGITKVPWYHAVWDSVQVADAIALPAAPAESATEPAETESAPVSEPPASTAANEPAGTP